MFNFFVLQSELGGKTTHYFLLRAPLGEGQFSHQAEHYIGRGKWAPHVTVKNGRTYGNAGEKRFKTSKAVNAAMRERALVAAYDTINEVPQ